MCHTHRSTLKTHYFNIKKCSNFCKNFLTLKVSKFFLTKMMRDTLKRHVTSGHTKFSGFTPSLKLHFNRTDSKLDLSWDNFTCFHVYFFEFASALYPHAYHIHYYYYCFVKALKFNRILMSLRTISS
jgi:hypothetical protein